ncbi:DUF1854 domain-containing protein [Paenibacillus lignilyticus]|uniref:DUF1854 domain-containing protein n=1 Tax=Paenibacillus lignilyticus TaxID=1172615 RepID=A0ABS5CAG1_9BACL|nr:DUF1854 domain-containing protein [Paenibacillus lignilyticus]MBP3962928.1 DUF1854 domain-containing protein [Paenibacillus lignilyticus]
MTSEVDKYDIRLFTPDDVYFSRGEGGVFQGIVAGVTYEELEVYRAFPFLYTTQYISIRNSKGEELGIVPDIKELYEESARELEKELQFRYFMPRVTRVDSVKFKSDLWMWELQTHLGATRMVMRNLHEHMQYPGGGRVILTDMSGKRCEITDWRELDAHSRKLLEEVL